MQSGLLRDAGRPWHLPPRLATPLLVPLHPPWLSSGCRRPPSWAWVPGERCLAAASAVGPCHGDGGSCGRRSFVTICQKALLPPALPSCPVSLPRPWRGGPSRAGRATRGRKRRPCSAEGPPVVPAQDPARGPVPHTARRTGDRESGRCPLSRPHGTGRHHPQLEGGETIPQTHWVTQLVRSTRPGRRGPSSTHPPPRRPQQLYFHFFGGFWPGPAGSSWA